MDLPGSVRVRLSDHELVPFLQPKLFLSIYECCKHRTNAIDDATALTEHVIAKLMAKLDSGQLTPGVIIAATHLTLKHFDKTAAAVYAAYHPLTVSRKDQEQTRRG